MTMIQQRPPAAPAAPANTEFETDAHVETKEQISDGVVALTLRAGQPFPPWAPGAHIDLILNGRQPVRQYSLCGDPADRTRWRVAVRREPAGRGSSRYVHDRLRVGDLVRVGGPRNRFPLVHSARYLFIAGGIGITPILPMIAAADAAGADWRLAYGGRRRSGMAFRDELAGYGDRATVHPRDEAGRLPLDALLGSPQADTLVYCCGPESLLAAVEQRCAAWPPGSLHVERFAARPLAEPIRDRAFDVVLARTGLTLTVPPDRSVLSVVEQAGAPVLYACAEGSCGTCETPVLEGRPDHRDSVLTDDERRACDRMLLCVSRSCTPRLVLDL